MDYLKLKISGLCCQLDTSGLRDELCDRLVKQFHSFLTGNGDTPDETIQIIPVKTGKLYRADPRINGLIRNNFKKISGKFPFSDISDRVTDEKIKKISPVLGDRKFHSIINKVENPDDIVIFPVNRGCLVRNQYTSETYLFLLIRFFRGISFSSISDAVYFTSAMALPDLDCVMLHGVGIKDGEKGYMFLGLSGSGKTTVACFSPGKEIISDDGLILERDKAGFCISAAPIDQSPACNEKSVAGERREVHLSAGFFLMKDNKNSLKKLLPVEACSIILKNHIHYFRYFPYKSVEKTFSLISELCRRIPFYALHFKKDASFWRSIEEEMPRLSKTEETCNGFR